MFAQRTAPFLLGRKRPPPRPGKGSFSWRHMQSASQHQDLGLLILIVCPRVSGGVVQAQWLVCPHPHPPFHTTLFGRKSLVQLTRVGSYAPPPWNIHMPIYWLEFFCRGHSSIAYLIGQLLIILRFKLSMNRCMPAEMKGGHGVKVNKHGTEGDPSLTPSSPSRAAPHSRDTLCAYKRVRIYPCRPPLFAPKW